MTNEEFLKSITLEGEMWKDITGYEGYYMVSSLGKVISLGRSITNNLGTRYQQPHVVAPCAVSSGYRMVRLWKNNKEQKFYIHRLVAISFIPNEHEYPEVDHIDCDKLNNKISNLRWCTRRMNQNNPITRVRNSISKKNHPKLKEINSKVVIRINPKNAEEIKFYKSCRSAKDDGFCESKVSAVCRGERPHHKGYKWYFLSDYENLINKSKNSSSIDHD